MDRPQDVANVLKGEKMWVLWRGVTGAGRWWATLILRKCASIWRRWAALL